MAVRAKEKAAHDALYDKAREKLPRVKAAYEEAVRQRYRFFSFGDAMFIASGAVPQA